MYSRRPGHQLDALDLLREIIVSTQNPANDNQTLTVVLDLAAMLTSAAHDVNVSPSRSPSILLYMLDLLYTHLRHAHD